ncbi:hypothetical protein C9374_014131 [Naegleria lovaniensis]|uniref:Uncharacterized protein n=1 Tax=Naegleria lovaniensis TaxID=51637 RepID=A0AA88H0Q7_NAELO|nr:uncharacterized protein C9374_014131 [Naegleria lovaniensis]KAG2389571.1 hypothetical protein C9374_014131 [Naegleria lovaniensis]
MLSSRRSSSSSGLSGSSNSPRMASLVSGISLILMFFVAMYSEMFVRVAMIQPNEKETTRSNIIQNRIQFQSGLVGYLVILACDIISAISMYQVFKSISVALSWWVGCLRMIYSVIFGYAILQLFKGYAVVMSDGKDFMDYFNSYESIWAFGLMIFGVHLVLLGILARRSSFVAKWISLMIVVAGVAYFLDNLLKLTYSNYENVKTVLTLCVAIPGIVGEVGLAVAFLTFYRSSRKN